MQFLPSSIISPANDPWEPETSRRNGRHQLTSIEVTVTNRCNLRCRHCAVGDTLGKADPERLPLDLLFRRLNEVPTLQTLSVTGGEPSENRTTLKEFVLPILRYARRRGLQTQINTNLTFDLERYRRIAPYVDVFHITWNYTDVESFHRIVWGKRQGQVSLKASEILFNRILSNARALSDEGYFLSAETMINRETTPHLATMNRTIAAMGCRRHEVHPMYPADWAEELPLMTLEEMRQAVNQFLDERDPDLWVLFGTFPFLACSPVEADRALVARAQKEPNVTIRNCPDGRNRLNINGFTGEVIVTDFADIPSLGNIKTHRLTEAFDRWQTHEAFAPYNCYCQEVGCTGPNLLVAQIYHPGIDFRTRKAGL